MVRILVLSIAAILALAAGEVIASGTLSVIADEDTPKNLTYANVRNALVTGDGGTSTYRYRIKTLGSSTLFLRKANADPVTLGSTVLMLSPTTAEQTDGLQYQAVADEFTLFPATSARSIDPVVVCTVDVLSSDGNTVIAPNIALRIDIQGSTDTRTGAGGYYVPTALTQAAPITVAQGGTLVYTYQQLAALYNWTDKERDGVVRFGGYFPMSLISVDNPPGSPWLDGDGNNGLIYHGTVTISIPANQPLGITDLYYFRFYYDPDGKPTLVSDPQTNEVILKVNVVSAGGTGGGSSGGGGGGGCGAGTVGGLILLGTVSALRRRRAYRA